jgi:hypothetical protein
MIPAELQQARQAVQTFSVSVAGRFAIDTWVHGATYSAVAYAVVPKVEGGLWYTVTGTGFNDTAYYGQTLSITFSAAGAVPRPADGHADTRLQDRGDTLWACLSSISGPLADLTLAEPYFTARFAGLRVTARVSVRAASG